MSHLHSASSATWAVFEPRSSRWWLAMVWGYHIAACGVLTQVSSVWGGLAGAWVLCHAGYRARHWTHPIQRFVWREGMPWVLHARDGMRYEATLRAPVRMGPWWVVLWFQSPHRRWPVWVVWQDALPHADFHRLKMVIQWGDT